MLHNSETLEISQLENFKILKHTRNPWNIEKKRTFQIFFEKQKKKTNSGWVA